MEDMKVSNSYNKYNDKFQKSINVTKVTGGKDTNPMLFPNINNEEFKKAVIASLISAGLYSPDDEYKLTIQIMNVGQPMFGLDMTVTMTIRYILTDSDNNIIFNKIINKSYTATVSDAFIGTKRFKLAKEGSARANISALLQEFTVSKEDIKNEIIKKEKEETIFKPISDD